MTGLTNAQAGLLVAASALPRGTEWEFVVAAGDGYRQWLDTLESRDS